MSHVDDGELTAYADGAYPAGDSDAQRIEAHLAQCENCRNRLNQARALSDRAAEILAVAAPLNVAVPDFAEIRSAAAIMRRRRAAVPLSWAATVILALGIGWFGRGALHNPKLQRSVMMATPQMEEAADMTAAGREPVAAPPERRPAEGTGAASRRAGAPRLDTKEEVQAANAVGQAIAADAAGARPPSASVEDSIVTGEKVTVGRVAAAADVEYMTAAVAEQRGLQLHIVPELEVMRVGLRGDEISVEQKLPDGKVVTIAANRRVGEERDFAAKSMAALAAPARVRNEGVAEGARARDRQQLLREAAETSVEVNRGALRLRISGVLSEDSLRALAAKIR